MLKGLDAELEQKPYLKIQNKTSSQKTQNMPKLKTLEPWQIYTVSWKYFRNV